MIPDLNVPDLPHPLSIRRNAKAGLGISIDRIGFRTKETQETKHVLHMHDLLAADASSDEFGRASGIHISGLLDRRPHNWSTVHIDGETRDTNFEQADSKGGISIRSHSETLGDRKSRSRDVHGLSNLSEMKNKIILRCLSCKR